MIVPATQALVASRNGTLTWLAPILAGGQSFNATGWVGKIQFRQNPGATGNPYLSLATNASPTPNGSSLVWTDITHSTLLLTIMQEDLASFPGTAQAPAPLICSYDLLLIDPTNEPNQYVQGTLTLSFGVTTP